MENNKNIKLNAEIEVVVSSEQKNFYSLFMERLGITREAWVVFTIASLLQFIWGCEACFISINMEALAKRDGISKESESLGVCLLYTMMGFGSILVGWMTKKWGRIFTLLLTTALFSFFTIGCSFFIRPLSFYPVLATRCLSNICLGIFNIVILNLMTEFLPTKNRSLVLMINSGFYNVGNLFLILLNYFFIEHGVNPNRSEIHNIQFDTYKWKLVNFLTAIPGLISFWVILRYQKESPLFLLNKHKEDEAFEIINEMLENSGSNARLSEEEKKKIKNSVLKKHNYLLKSDYKELFYPEYLSLTIYSLLICSICYLNMIGISYLVPRSIKELGERKIYNLPYYSQLIIYALIQIPNGFIGGWMTESRLFGRRRTIWISSVFCAIFYFISYSWPKFMFAYAGQIMLFNSIAFGCAFIYVTEAFPTNIRDQAQSFIQFFSFLLGSWSPYLIDKFHSEEIMINFLILGVSCIICAGVTFLLPFETQSRPLDEDVEL